MTKWMRQFTQSPEGKLWAVLAPLPALEVENLTWQRVDIVMAGATPGAASAIAGLRKWLAQQKAAPDLRMTPLNAAALTTASTGGLYGATTTGRVYGVYIRKAIGAAAGTASYLELVDDGTDGALSGLAGSIKLVLPLGAIGSAQPGAIQDSVWVCPQGLPLAAGLRFAVATAAGGVVISATGDAGDGFCLTTP